MRKGAEKREDGRICAEEAEAAGGFIIAGRSSAFQSFANASLSLYMYTPTYSSLAESYFFLITLCITAVWRTYGKGKANKFAGRVCYLSGIFHFTSHHLSIALCAALLYIPPHQTVTILAKSFSTWNQYKAIRKENKSRRKKKSSLTREENRKVISFFFYSFKRRAHTQKRITSIKSKKKRKINSETLATCS